MKHLAFILTIISMLGTAQAKVEDFNSIINEDIKAQKELHKEFKKTVVKGNSQDEAILAEKLTETRKKEVIVLENSQSEFISPSNDQLFRFKKELKQKTTNSRKNQHRVAKEVKDLDI